MEELNVNEIKKENDSDYYTYLSELESIRDRKDRSVLKVCSVYPERFLTRDIAHPEEVKHLTIILGFTSSCVTYTYYTWYRRGNNDTLCSDIVNFHNLETLTATDLNLSEDLWIEFANNSKNLKEIHFSSSCESDENDDFDFDKKEKALDAIFKISTLEKICIDRLYLPYFPPGPSNIKHLELYVSGEDPNVLKIDDRYFEQIKSYSNNFVTHTNIKILILDVLHVSPYNIKDLKLDQMIQLEELELRSCCYIGDIQEILMLPNLKKFYCFIERDKDDSSMKTLINTDFKFPSVEEITISVWISNNFNFDETKKHLAEILEKQCLNLKKFVFKNRCNS
jgi:hypothetical protein